MLKENPELDGTSITINLPMAQVLDKSFNVRINSIVNRYGIAHNRIGLEFTERAILENFDQLQHIMEQLSQDGYKFYLDDFGSGYSNFNCLLQLPFRYIKLDMQLIRQDLSSSGEQRLGLIGILTQFLHAIGLTIIAEGIETNEEAAALSDIGVDRIQGYIHARPMSEK